jgi:sigma-B regulation protein RsbU (phosphoserine phosphatase)
MGHNILAVEDDQDAVANLRDILELDGHSMTGVSTLKEAIERSPWSEFSVILLDRKLPDGNSDTILPRIREIAPHLGVIVITGYADLNATITAVRSGASDYLLKPINPDVLRASITRVLKMREMEERTLQAERLAAVGDLLQAAPDAMFQIDSDGRIQLMNENAERMSGYSAAELAGQSVEILVFEPQREAHAEHRRRFFEHPLSRPMGTGLELFLRRKDDSAVPVDICLGHRRLNQQDYVIASVRDVTERRRIETALREATAAVERAYESMRRDVEAAAQLQRQLLPAQLPAVAGVRFGWEFRPSAVLGGDGLNVFSLDDDHLGVYLLDVSGHGVAAALLSVTLAHLLSPGLNPSSLLRAPQGDGHAYRITRPAEVARQLNEWLLANPAGEKYFTIVYGILNVRTRCFRYVSAGHPPLIHVPHDGEIVQLRVPGHPIGCLLEAEYEETELQLRDGDRLFLYSDGLTEATGPAGEQFGGTRFQQAILATKGEPLETCIQRVASDVIHWAQNDLKDDLSVLGLGIE